MPFHQNFEQAFLLLPCLAHDICLEIIYVARKYLYSADIHLRCTRNQEEFFSKILLCHLCPRSAIPAKDDVLHGPYVPKDIPVFSNKIF